MYQCERTYKVDSDHSTLVKLQFTLSTDGSYLQQGYLSDQLVIEERGRYSQTGDLLTYRDRFERRLSSETQLWGAWKTPDSGTEDSDRVRNVTGTTFQVYDKREKNWYTFSRL